MQRIARPADRLTEQITHLPIPIPTLILILSRGGCRPAHLLVTLLQIDPLARLAHAHVHAREVVPALAVLVVDRHAPHERLPRPVPVLLPQARAPKHEPRLRLQRVDRRRPP